MANRNQRNSGAQTNRSWSERAQRGYKESRYREPQMVREQGPRAASPVVPYRPDIRSRPMADGTRGSYPQTIDGTATTVKERVRKFGPLTRSRMLHEALGVARRLNQITRAEQIADIISDLAGGLQPGRRGSHGRIIPKVTLDIPGFTKCDGDYGPPFDNADGLHIRWGVIDCTKGQITGQGYSGDYTSVEQLYPGATLTSWSNGLPIVPPPGQNSVMPQWGRSNGYGAEHSSHVRTHGLNPGQSPLVRVDGVPYGPVTNVTTNPNVERERPGDPPPMRENKSPKQERYPRYPKPVRDINGYGNPDASTTVPYVPGTLNMNPPAASAHNVPPNGGPPTPTRPIGRRPPGRRTKEKKVLSKSKRIGIGIFNLMDFMSESADIIDAIYEALPKDVQKRWARGRRGAVDQFGQYGINGADWKLQAIYHNWHKLDAVAAVENIIKNELEDKVYGAIHKHLPKQAGGQAMEPAWKQFGELMKSLGF